jgi:acyl-CoA synthetase (AMP-forming)/AMP-acid ligase II
MLGQMMQQPLLISSFIVHAERHHADQEVVSRRVEGDIHRTTYKADRPACAPHGQGLAGLGVQQGDRVATLAWNGYRHMELYFAVSGSGAVLHTLNPRLHPDQVTYIADHAENQVLFFDMTFLPLVQAVASRTKTVRHWVAMTDRAHMPPPGAGREDPQPAVLRRPDRQPRRPLHLASTSTRTPPVRCATPAGTTGNPKGVLYSHRSTRAAHDGRALPDCLGCSAADTMLPVVPMFHVNSWGIVYLAPMTGAKLVLPGAGLDGKSLYELFESEGVTISAGVPTVWQGSAGPRGRQRPEVQHHAAQRHRWLGLPAGDDQDL